MLAVYKLDKWFMTRTRVVNPFKASTAARSTRSFTLLGSCVPSTTCMNGTSSIATLSPKTFCWTKRVIWRPVEAGLGLISEVDESKGFYQLVFGMIMTCGKSAENQPEVNQASVGLLPTLHVLTHKHLRMLSRGLDGHFRFPLKQQFMVPLRVNDGHESPMPIVLAHSTLVYNLISIQMA